MRHKSNSSMQYFPDNKTSNFVTKLSRTLQLDGDVGSRSS